jgi:hypothetical protein
MPLTNRWNQFIYHLWAPVYDRAFTRLFAAGRRQAMAALHPSQASDCSLPASAPVPICHCSRLGSSWSGWISVRPC